LRTLVTKFEIGNLRRVAMRPRRLAVEMLESRIVLNGLGLGSEASDRDWVSVIVTLNDRTDQPRAVAEQVLSRVGGQLGHVYEHALKGFSLQLPAAAATKLAERHPLIQAVEFDLAMHTFAQVVPNGVQRIGTMDNTIAAIGSGAQEINVGIAIIDTGIASHPDLNLAGGTRFYTVNSGPPKSRGSFEDGNYFDDNGHGTHVAGIAAALDNDDGVVGVAPGAPLWAVKVLDASGNGWSSDIIKGIDWVTANRDDIAVANMSLGGQGASTAYRQAIQNSVAAGVVYVVAAGNSGMDIHGSDKTFGTSDDFIPAAYPEVAAISAFVDTDGQAGGEGSPWYWSAGTRWLADDTFADFSNFSNSDEAKNQHFLDANIAILGEDRHALGLGIDLVMPGVSIYSTYLNGGYATMTGTSMAAPHAAGLAALHIAGNGRATDANGVYEIRKALIDMGNPWRSPLGLVHPGIGVPNPDSPDGYEENVGWAGNTVIERAPTVTIDEPTDGANLWDCGGVTIQATATAFGEETITQVEFFVSDNTPIGVGEVGEDGWVVVWSTKDAAGNPLYPDGTYTIEAVATDSAGKTGSDSILVHLDNVDDPPTVAITSPVGGTVSGAVIVTAEANDDRGVDRVEFFVDAQSIGEDTDGTDGWSLGWDTTGVADGLYTITAVATDIGGNSSSSPLVNVAVSNDAVTGTMTAQLSGIAQSVNRNFWQALVTVTVVDAVSNNGLPGATVSGFWSTNSAATGTTGASGAVTFSSGNLRTNVGLVTFTLTDVVLADYDYVPGSGSITVYSNGTTTVKAIRLDNELTVVSGALTNLVLDAGFAPANDVAGGLGTATVAGSEASGASDTNDLREQHTAAFANGNGSAVAASAATVSSKRFADDQPQDDSVVSSLDASAVDQLLAIGW
jgi:subtilisin family serine protease